MMKRFSNVSYGTMVRNWIDDQPIGNKFQTRDISLAIGIDVRKISPALCYLEKAGDLKKSISGKRGFDWEKIRNCTIKDHTSKRRPQKVTITRRANVLHTDAFSDIENSSLAIAQLKEENARLRAEFVVQRDIILNALCAIEALMKEQ